MYGALRRCPASLSRAFSTTILSPRSVRSAISQVPITTRVLAPRINNVAIAAFHQSAKWRQNAPVEASEEAQTNSEEPITRFKDLAEQGLVHPNVIDAITRQMKLDTMTEVQKRTINEALSGADVIAQAKTGTGKTLGFLIPILQRMIQHDPKLGDRAKGYKSARSDDIRAIVISPTRELAEQIAVEARKVTSGTRLVVQVAVGGTQKRSMLQKVQREGCHLLIATPGRLYDILSDEYSGVNAPHLNALVLDEADRLLDQGFQQDIQDIMKLLPDISEVDRQTLMFSATIPREVVNLVRQTLKEGFHFAKCVDENEEPTHERVPQKVVNVAGFENIMPALYEFGLRQMEATKSGESRPFKAIVYFNSTAEVTLAASVWYKLCGGFKRNTPMHGARAFEIHAKLSQAQRTRATEDFRFAKSGILFSSDVTARGMDFPNVTHVIQVGLPKDRDTYIHRIGRTGRAGKEGEGILFVTPLERHEVRKRLNGLPIKEDTSLETAAVDMSQPEELPANVAHILEQVTEASSKVYPDQLEAAFRGVFGSFQWFGDKQSVLEAANRWAEYGWGMSNPPQPPASLFSGRRGGSGRRPGGFGDRRSSGGFADRRSDGFNDRGSGSYGGRSSGGFGERRGGGSSGGGYGDRDRRSGGDFQGRSGGFKERSGGFKERSGGFKERFGGRGKQAEFEF